MDTLSSLMEVKLDIREKRSDWLPLRTWTRCYVKIEAIKCFPCYMKITFHKRQNYETDQEGLVFRINIPGLEVYPVASRTKSFAYGLFWKQNRKDCRAYLSMDTKLSRDAHMRWVDCQVQDLESYRKDVLQSSRFCRATMDRSMIEESGLYQNMNNADETAALTNGQESSEHDASQSRRVSSIYEEIVDFKESRTKPRESVIYEEMRLNHSAEATTSSSSPPPLPPRTRLNTECSMIQRSYTNPESDMMMMSKKKWSLFDNVFGKSKKSEAKRREKSHLLPKELQLLKAKRNSFSSPDLSHLDASLERLSTDHANCSFESDAPANISASNSYELDNLNEVDEDFENDQPNVSYNIKPNFHLNLDANSSSVNLIGSNCNLPNRSYLEQPSTVIQPSTTPPGYLEMRPGKGFDRQKVEELDRQLENEYIYRLKYSYESPINFRRESDYNLPPPADSLYSNTPKKSAAQDEPHYVCMTRGRRVSSTTPVAEITHKTTPVKSAGEPIYLPMNRSNKQRQSIDDKVASYYPNYDVPIRKTPVARVTPLNKSNSIAIPSRTPKRNGSVISQTILHDNNDIDERYSESPKKYATLSRVQVPSSIESELSESSPPPSPTGTLKSNKSSRSISPNSFKRFASLPRFKKIDFSPLRMKISSVLQRSQNPNHTNGC